MEISIEIIDRYAKGSKNMVWMHGENSIAENDQDKIMKFLRPYIPKYAHVRNTSPVYKN
jgi:hypothetical protein